MTSIHPLRPLPSQIKPLRACWRFAAQLLLGLLCLSGVAKADFTFNSSTGTITGYVGAGGAVVIPASINGTPVTAIGEAAFSPGYRGNQSIISVTIPDSVTSIGQRAFPESCEIKRTK